MNQYVRSFFYFDPIAVIMIGLILFIGICIGSFAFRYMKGDHRYSSFFFYLTFLIVSIGIVVSADHMLVLFAGWCISNLLLVRLMIHKHKWRAAKNSGILAAKNYLFGAACVAVAFLLLYFSTGQTSIKALVSSHLKSPWMVSALFFLLIGAMTQSAIWPFHRWLISSLNSPTPVSAIMHAGLINGGGFLLARFARLYLNNPYLLTTIFVVGITTALIGTLWKLMQHDVKRMLACSTMGQMGFMLVQCGLGLFPAAIAHLVTHGMFKAFLFLASGDAAKGKKYDLRYPPKTLIFSYALICGLIGSYCFALASGKPWPAEDATLVLLVIAFLTTSQSALSILNLRTPYRVPLSLILASAVGFIYGTSVYLISTIMEPMELMKPQPLNIFHVGGITLLVLGWLSILFFKKTELKTSSNPWFLKTYVATLNASQPSPSTVTTHRNYYKYL